MVGLAGAVDGLGEVTAGVWEVKDAVAGVVNDFDC